MADEVVVTGTVTEFDSVVTEVPDEALKLEPLTEVAEPEIAVRDEVTRVDPVTEVEENKPDVAGVDEDVALEAIAPP